MEVPPAAVTLEGFRAWAASGDFPPQARIAFLQGRLLIDMSPESYESHLRLKHEITYAIETLVREKDLGEVFIDGAWFTHPEAEVSNEPDVMFASWETLKSGRLKPVAPRDHRYDEMSGSPDWVCEIVSDSSIKKDNRLLRQAYFQAGIPEYWLLDARGEQVDFKLMVAGATEYVEQPADADGFRVSSVFGSAFRVHREEDQLGRWKYRLEHR